MLTTSKNLCAADRQLAERTVASLGGFYTKSEDKIENSDSTKKRREEAETLGRGAKRTTSDGGGSGGDEVAENWDDERWRTDRTTA